ncbi:MAG: hypothetical protein IPI58_06505 [Alphaproteobacteria bacterium]|nr:MAG: hypothetical protein IPI58_06505 [Alphaproteobacteria bacterium]
MLKMTIIGFMLALFTGPLAAYAETPGQPGQKEQIGTTKLADDKQSNFALLETEEAPPHQLYVDRFGIPEWQSLAFTPVPSARKETAKTCVITPYAVYYCHRWGCRRLWRMQCTKHNEPVSGNHR